MRAIGERLREVRGQRTLAEFSEKVGVGRTTWSNYEAGRRLPSYEVLELLRRQEGVTPDQILPTAALAHTIEPVTTNDWWSFIPALWLFARLRGSGRFASEEEEFAWWAERIQSLAEEFAGRAFELAEKRDLELPIAANEVCKLLSKRSLDELLAFADHKK